MSSRARRATFFLITFFCVCALAGTVLQSRVGAQSATDQSQFRDNLKQFTDVYALVEQNYAEPIVGDKADDVIFDGAIPSMLHVLDPHSNFYDPKAYAKMREDQQGRYFGVGMLIQQQKDKIYVVTPYEGTPSYKAGIHPGDIIASIDGKSTTGMDSMQVSKLLKGPRGTSVTLTTVRYGSPQPLSFTLVRDEIPHPSVDLAFEIQPGVGYIHLANFSSETAGKEVDDAVDSFGNLKGLVLDLRGNPGGLLSQAVEICDHLLSKGQIIVSQRGRAYPDQVYTVTHGNGGKLYPIVVLVNRNTASAAEIVSGALQDHDRALIAGETTFGKGLVQTVYNMSDATALALTTYHYYTPSGRLIQRDYKGVSLYDYYYNHANALPADKSNREVKLTDSGRTVYGGGGITPDVKIETPKANHFTDELLGHDVFFHFAPEYVANHPTVKKFEMNDDVLAEFKKYLTTEKVPWTEADFAANLEWVKANVKAKIVTILVGQAQGLRVEADWDPMIQKAITYLPQAQSLVETAQKANAQKAAAHLHASN